MAVYAVSAQDKSCPKIVGGCAADKDDWPSLAALRLSTDDERVASYFCGGTVIAERWVLTAAHCLQDFTVSLEQPVLDSKQAPYQGRLQVVLGADDLREVQPSQVFGVDRIIIHEIYRAAIDEANKIVDTKARREALATIALRVGYDIALLRLDRPAPVEPGLLSLISASDPHADGVEVRVSGFGTTEHNMNERVLPPVARRDGLLSLVSIARAGDSGDAYGTVVHADGSMTAIYKSKRHLNLVYVVKFTKDGQLVGGCEKESIAAWQARKAYMTAKSEWRAGYVPRKLPCMV